MARRKGSGGKGKKVHIDPNNKSEMKVLTALVNSERYISKDTFLSMGSKAMLSRWTKAGYIEESKTGFLKATDAFYKEARYRTTPAIKTSGSGSPIHSQGIVNAIRLLPSSLPFQDKSGERLIQNSQEVKDSFREWRTGAGRYEYEKRDAEIRQEWKEAPSRAENALNEAKALGDGKAYADAMRAYQEAVRLAERAETEQSVVSTPDLTVKMTASEMIEYAENLRGHGEEMSQWRNREAYTKAAERLEQIASSISGGGRVEIAVEITTEHYSGVDIATHAAYAEMQGAEVIFVPST